MKWLQNCYRILSSFRNYWLEIEPGWNWWQKAITLQPNKDRPKWGPLSSPGLQWAVPAPPSEWDTLRAVKLSSLQCLEGHPWWQGQGSHPHTRTPLEVQPMPAEKHWGVWCEYFIEPKGNFWYHYTHRYRCIHLCLSVCAWIVYGVNVAILNL